MKMHSACRLGLVLALALVFSACNLGGPSGSFESLEAEMAHIDTEMDAWLSDAFPDSVALGSSVAILPCDPSDALLASISIAIQPSGDVDAERARVLDSLESEGLNVDRSQEGYPLMPVYFVLPGTSVEVVFLTASADSPRPGIKVISDTGCYRPSRIDAEDPFSLARDEGVSIVGG